MYSISRYLPSVFLILPSTFHFKSSVGNTKDLHKKSTLVLNCELTEFL